MPRLSYFYGIAVYVYYEDHLPPHVHARYAEHEAQIAIATGEVVAGWLPLRASRLVEEWRAIHVRELAEAWVAVHEERAPDTIEPLP